MTQADKLSKLQQAELARLETMPAKFWLTGIIVAICLEFSVIFGAILLDGQPRGTIGAPESIMLEFAEEPTAPEVDNVSETIQEATNVDKATDPVEEDQKDEEEKPQEVVEEKTEDEIKTPESDMVEEVKKPVEEVKPQKPIEKPKPKPKKHIAAKRPAKLADHTQESSGPLIAAKSGSTYAGPVTNRTDGNFGREAANWKSKVQRRIEIFVRRTVRYNGKNRTVSVTFTFDRSGNITSAKITRPSGDVTIDASTLQAVRRASPIPAPPADWSSALTVPVEIERSY